MRFGILFAAILVALPSFSSADEKPADDPIYSNHCSDVPERTEPLIKDTADALRIGYATFRSAVPEVTKDEKVWIGAMTVKLRVQDCVWEIREKPTKKYPRSNFVMGLGSMDGRFLGILMLE